MLIKASFCNYLPSKPGIYLFLGSKNEVLYVGKAKNLKKRVGSYFVNKAYLLEKTKILVSQVEKIRHVVAGSEIEALLLEANHIKQYKPKYNTRLADGKMYPLIRITIKDDFPKVLISRRAEDKNSLYFGPFPNSTNVYLVLKTLRKIFPYQSVLNHPKKPCLYYHLGLCPCPEVFDKDTPCVRSILLQKYKKNISHLIDFLNGRTKKVIKDLIRERDRLSRNEEFENARDIQKKLDAIEYITNPVYKAFDYKVIPSLSEDSSREQVNNLVKELNRNSVFVKKLRRIECFDISNIAGTNATGSMVVFINGEKDPSQYRRFRIRNLPNFPNLPNDFAMMQQVISRRLKHKEWTLPNLIVVDGGKGQVSSALSVIKEQKMKIPVIGLAKREEVIITSDFKQIILPRSSEALKIVMRIRDEAHRFALSYHQKLRSKTFFI